MQLYVSKLQLPFSFLFCTLSHNGLFQMIINLMVKDCKNDKLKTVNWLISYLYYVWQKKPKKKM